MNIYRGDIIIPCTVEAESSTDALAKLKATAQRVAEEAEYPCWISRSRRLGGGNDSIDLPQAKVVLVPLGIRPNSIEHEGDSL